MEPEQIMNILNSLSIVLLYFIFTVVIHLFTSRMFPTSKFMVRGLTLGFLSVLGMIVYEVRINELDLLSVYLLGTGWLAYMMFFINLINSATLKMLEHLAKHDTLVLSEFMKVFNEDVGLKSRLLSMKKNNFIDIQDGKIESTQKARKLLQKVFLLRRILSIDQVG